MSLAFQQRTEEEIAPIMPATSRLATPRILRIARYRLKPGTEAAVRNLQKQVALAMARWPGPHPFLCAESLTGPKEIWCLSGFQSPDEHREAAESLESNEALRLALHRIEGQLHVLTGSPAVILAHHCVGNRCWRPWLMGRGRFLIVASGQRPISEGTVYESPEGVRYRISSTRARRHAEILAAAAGLDANLFAVRPTWGMPALSWTRADRVFWKSSPLVRLGADPLPSPGDRARIN
jgi:hypothetical protein